jgi:P27 family predicted phage terminase small subunit
MPEPPDWLSPGAVEVWNGLDATKVATADTDALVVYCCAVADYVQAQRLLDRSGPLVRGARGGVVRSPLNIVKADNAATILSMARQLGLLGKEEPTEPKKRRNWRNRRATEHTITALRNGGRLEGVDDAVVALARHLSDGLDLVDPGRYPTQTATLARAQLGTLRLLRGDREDEQQRPGPRNVDELLSFLSSEVGDTPNP